jgi:hypothetical protein
MILSICISILLGVVSFTSTNEIIPEKEYNYEADFFSTDGFGNLYIVQNSELIKINISDGKKLVYSNFSSGKISSIDPADPFRILVYYKDFNKIVFLDKNLTEIISPITLDDKGIYNAISVCQSVNGGFWVLDQNSAQLLYLDKSLNIVKKSAVIEEIYDQNTDTKQAFMLEKNDYIYVGFENAGVMQFDSYGVYIKTFPTINFANFQVIDNVIVYYSEGKLNYYNTQNYQEKSLKIPIENIVRTAIEGNRLFVQTGKKILVYNLKNFKE